MPTNARTLARRFREPNDIVKEEMVMSWNVAFSHYANCIEEEINRNFQCPYHDPQICKQYAAAKMAVLAMVHMQSETGLKGDGPAKLYITAIGHVNGLTPEQRSAPRDDAPTFVRVEVVKKYEDEQ